VDIPGRQLGAPQTTVLPASTTAFTRAIRDGLDRFHARDAASRANAGHVIPSHLAVFMVMSVQAE
jgi:hypothetical protein